MEELHATSAQATAARAGTLGNIAMLDEQPTRVLALPGLGDAQDPRRALPAERGFTWQGVGFLRMCHAYARTYMWAT